MTHLQAKEGQGMLAATRKLQIARKDPFLETPRKQDAANTLIFDLWLPELGENKVLLFEAPSLWFCYGSPRNPDRWGLLSNLPESTERGSRVDHRKEQTRQSLVLGKLGSWGSWGSRGSRGTWGSWGRWGHWVTKPLSMQVTQTTGVHLQPSVLWEDSSGDSPLLQISAQIYMFGTLSPVFPASLHPSNSVLSTESPCHHHLAFTISQKPPINLNKNCLLVLQR